MGNMIFSSISTLLMDFIEHNYVQTSINFGYNKNNKNHLKMIFTCNVSLIQRVDKSGGQTLVSAVRQAGGSRQTSYQNQWFLPCVGQAGRAGKLASLSLAIYTYIAPHKQVTSSLIQTATQTIPIHFFPHFSLYNFKSKREGGREGGDWFSQFARWQATTVARLLITNYSSLYIN